MSTFSRLRCAVFPATEHTFYMAPRPIISLITDFGTEDGFVGAMKGRILRDCAEANIVDITHAIPPQDIVAANWAVKRGCLEFPADTIHVVVVDPSVGSNREALIIRANEQWYIGPNNGVFSLLLSAHPAHAIYTIDRDSPRWHKHNSFDGLMLFAPVASLLANGTPANELGSPLTTTLINIPEPVPLQTDTGWQGQIVAFDHFGNAITNLPGELLQPSTRLAVHSLTIGPASHYAASDSGAPIAICNSDIRVEIAINQGNARVRLNLALGDKVTLF